MEPEEISYSHFIGEEKAGETRTMKSSLLGIDEPLMDHNDGVKTLAEAYL